MTALKRPKTFRGHLRTWDEGGRARQSPVLASIQPCETGCSLHTNHSWGRAGEGKPPYIPLRLLTGGYQGQRVGAVHLGMGSRTYICFLLLCNNLPQISGIKQHSFISLQICRSEVWAQHVWVLSKAEIKVSAKLHSFLEVSSTSQRHCF